MIKIRPKLTQNFIEKMKIYINSNKVRKYMELNHIHMEF